MSYNKHKYLYNKLDDIIGGKYYWYNCKIFDKQTENANWIHIHHKTCKLLNDLDWLSYKIRNEMYIDIVVKDGYKNEFLSLIENKRMINPDTGIFEVCMNVELHTQGLLPENQVLQILDFAYKS